MVVILPFHVILHLSFSGPVVQDAFDFIFFFSFYDIREGWFWVRSVDIVLGVFGEKRGVEYVVDLPCFR